MISPKASIAYIDYLGVIMNLFMVVAAILIIQVVTIQKGNNTSKAEYLVQLDWADTSNSDVDLWVQNPFGDVVWWNKKDTGFMTLDRDDQGASHNVQTQPDGTVIKSQYRREIISLRSIITGRFVVNVMLFSVRDPVPVHVKVTVIKLNPFKEVFTKELDLTDYRAQVTAGSFQMLKDGTFGNVDLITQYQMNP